MSNLMYYHIIRVREEGRKADNPVIAYFGVTTDRVAAERFADRQEEVGGTYMDVQEGRSSNFDMSWLEEA